MSELAELQQQVKKDVRTVLLFSSKEQTVSEVLRTYEDYVGSTIPFSKLGFRSCADFLRSIPDVVQTRNDRYGNLLLTVVANKETQYLKSLAEKSKPNKYNNKKNSNSRSHQSGTSERNGAPEASKNSWGQRISVSFLGHRSQMSERTVEIVNATSGYSPKVVPRFIQTNILKLLENFVPEGLSIESFPVAYMKKYGLTMDYKQLGYPTLHSCLADIPDVLTIKMIHGKQRIFKSHAQTTPSRESPQLTVQCYGPNINDKVKQNIQKLLRMYPSGILAHEFADKYKELTKTNLDLRSLGCYSIMEMVAVLPEVVGSELLDDKSSYLLFDLHAPSTTNLGRSNQITDTVKENILNILDILPEGIQENQLGELYKANFSKDLLCPSNGFNDIQEFMKALLEELPITLNEEGFISRKKNPPKRTINVQMNDVVLPGEEYTCQEIPNGYKQIGYLFPIVVAHVDSPESFWIQLKENEIELKTIMAHMQSIYSGDENGDLDMPDTFMRVSMPCVAVFPEDLCWYRGTIVSIPSREQVGIQFVDYGNSMVIQRQDLKMLKKSFLNYPTQALQARLANCQPNQEEWSKKSVIRFQQFTSELPICASITSLTYKDCLSLNLYMDKENINYIMIEEGFARYFSDKTIGNPCTDSRKGIIDPFIAQTMLASFEPTCGSSIVSDGNTTATNSPPMYEDITEASAMEFSNYHRSGVLERKLPDYQPSTRPDDHKDLSKIDPEIKRILLAMSQNSNSLEHQISPNTYLSDDEFEGSDVYQAPLNSGGPKSVMAPFNQAASPVYRVPTKKNCLHRIKLKNGESGHLVNFEGRPYFTTSDISHFLYGLEIVEKLVKLYLFPVEMLTLFREDFPGFFEEMKMKSSRGYAQENDQVVLYELESCKALAVAENKTFLAMELQAIIDNFHPGEACWTEPQHIEPKFNPLCLVVAKTAHSLEEDFKREDAKRVELINQMLVNPLDIKTFNQLEQIYQNQQMIIDRFKEINFKDKS